jgi:hypothetical protein
MQHTYICIAVLVTVRVCSITYIRWLSLRYPCIAVYVLVVCHAYSTAIPLHHSVINLHCSICNLYRRVCINTIHTVHYTWSHGEIFVGACNIRVGRSTIPTCLCTTVNEVYRTCRALHLPWPCTAHGRREHHDAYKELALSGLAGALEGAESMSKYRQQTESATERAKLAFPYEASPNSANKLSCPRSQDCATSAG